ncbi:MAG: hypothetical protein H0V26_11330 [Solirubrobacterales bacterium]|nr:hypothetical protein [Solirubrobacterales bacterium]
MAGAHAIPWRGRTGERPRFGFPLPGEPMPLQRGGRPLKRWRWVGCFAPEVMLCAASAQVGPGRISWWAVWDGERSELSQRSAHFSRPVSFTEGGLRRRRGLTSSTSASCPRATSSPSEASPARCRAPGGFETGGA